MLKKCIYIVPKTLPIMLKLNQLTEIDMRPNETQLHYRQVWPLNFTIIIVHGIVVRFKSFKS